MSGEWTQPKATPLHPDPRSNSQLSLGQHHPDQRLSTTSITSGTCSMRGRTHLYRFGQRWPNFEAVRYRSCKSSGGPEAQGVRSPGGYKEHNGTRALSARLQALVSSDRGSQRSRHTLRPASLKRPF